MENMMRALLVLLAATLTWALAPNAQAADWQMFQPQGGGFRVEMPGKPDVKSEERNGRKVDTALVAIDKASAGADLVFMVKYQARDEAPGPDAHALLDRVVGAMAEGNTLVSKNAEDIGGFPARTFVIQDKDKDVYQVRVVLTDRYFTQVMFIGPQDNELGKRFLGSFAIQ
jgi:hypothetical protein